MRPTLQRGMHFSSFFASPFLPLLLLLLQLAEVHGHGYLSFPPSRNLLARERGQDYCPHCLNGGTVGTVQSNSLGGVWPYPETAETAPRHGLCGDPSPLTGAQQQYMAGGALATGQITSTFTAGDIIEVQFSITTHHRGHVEFSLCDTANLDNPSGPITQECLDAHKLRVVPDPTDLSFVDPSYPNRYYLPPKCAGNSPGVSRDPFYADAWVYKALVQLPTGLSCDHCVLQWYYVTGNTCNAPGYRSAPWPSKYAQCSGDGPGLGWWAPSLRDCESSYPEEFWNCADVRISSDGGQPAPPTPRPTDSAPSPTSSPPSTWPPSTSRPTPSPTGGNSDDVNCLPKWASCGSQLQGTRCCQAGLQCYAQHQWYSQCLPSCPPGWACDNLGGAPTPRPASPTPPPTSPTPDPTVATPPPSMEQLDCLPQWSGCGGGQCCQGALQCYRKNQWYSQCLQACPPGWDCDTVQQPTSAPPTPGNSPRPTPPPSTSNATPQPTPTFTAAESPWDLGTNTIYYNGRTVQLHGVAVTCLEYLLRGIGGECLAAYNWAEPANLITQPDPVQVAAIADLLLGSPAPAGTMPAARLSLNAAYFLDVETPAWAANRARYPDLASQYRTLLSNLVEAFTGRGIVTILDLHWNDDVTEQQAMALRDTDGSTGDSVAFWTALASQYGDNPLVWYELYNEPFVASYATWLNGGNGYEGMRQMYAAVRAHTTYPIVLAGAANYAYDAESLVAFEREVRPTGVVYNLHPYMGPYQRNDASKNIDGYEERVERVLAGTGRPLIITEFGQYCCPANGACYLYDGAYEGVQMGFVEAVLRVNVKHDVSWTAWAWRPQRPGQLGDCNQPDANAGVQLYDPDGNDGAGADWSVLFPQYY